MTVPCHLLTKFLHDQRGATAIEYALVVAGIATVVVVAVNLLGGTVSGQYSSVEAGLRQRTP